MPSISPGRGSRVVTDTDMVMFLSAARSLRDRVVLPAPEGDDMTSSRPLRAISVLWITLLNVLHLFTHLIDDCFQLKANGRQGLVEGFGTECVGFAVKLLGQKIEFAACRFGGGDQGTGCLKGGKPGG